MYMYLLAWCIALYIHTWRVQIQCILVQNNSWKHPYKSSVMCCASHMHLAHEILIRAVWVMGMLDDICTIFAYTCLWTKPIDSQPHSGQTSVMGVQRQHWATKYTDKHKCCSCWAERIEGSCLFLCGTPSLTWCVSTCWDRVQPNNAATSTAMANLHWTTLSF